MPNILVCSAINWDIMVFVDRFPNPGEEVHVMRVISVPGGKAANTAVAAVKILGTNNVGIIGMLGLDDIAESQRDRYFSRNSGEEGEISSPCCLLKSRYLSIAIHASGVINVIYCSGSSEYTCSLPATRWPSFFMCE